MAASMPPDTRTIPATAAAPEQRDRGQRGDARYRGRDQGHGACTKRRDRTRIDEDRKGAQHDAVKAGLCHQRSKRRDADAATRQERVDRHVDAHRQDRDDRGRANRGEPQPGRQDREGCPAGRGKQQAEIADELGCACREQAFGRHRADTDGDQDETGGARMERIPRPGEPQKDTGEEWQGSVQEHGSVYRRGKPDAGIGEKRKTEPAEQGEKCKRRD